ncbi:MAG TPA: hypothetical protein VGO93_08125 [Candidatus Xenobia bacterium]|jgi:chromosome segregation ATPase
MASATSPVFLPIPGSLPPAAPPPPVGGDPGDVYLPGVPTDPSPSTPPDPALEQRLASLKGDLDEAKQKFEQDKAAVLGQVHAISDLKTQLSHDKAHLDSLYVEWQNEAMAAYRVDVKAPDWNDKHRQAESAERDYEQGEDDLKADGNRLDRARDDYLRAYRQASYDVTKIDQLEQQRVDVKQQMGISTYPDHSATDQLTSLPGSG